MTRRASILPSLVMLALIAALGSCARPEAEPVVLPPQTAEDAVHALFVVAAMEDPTETDLALLAEETLVRRHLTELLEALAGVAEFGAPEIVATEPLDGEERVALDFEAVSPHGTTGTFSLHAVRGADGTWRIIWLQGPGVSWPPRTDAGGTDGSGTAAPRA